MKIYPWFFLVIAIIMYNGMLIQRDKQLFEAHDQACSELSQPHPDCRYSR